MAVVEAATALKAGLAVHALGLLAYTRYPESLEGARWIRTIDLVFCNLVLIRPSAAQIDFWESTLRRMAQAPEWKENLEKNHWTENFLIGPQLAKEIEQEYSYLKSMLMDLGLVKQ